MKENKNSMNFVLTKNIKSNLFFEKLTVWGKYTNKLCLTGITYFIPFQWCHLWNMKIKRTCCSILSCMCSSHAACFSVPPSVFISTSSYVRPSLCRSIICPSVFLSVWPSFCLPIICLSAFLSVCPSICPSFGLSLSVCLFVRLPFCLSVHPSVCPSVRPHLSVSLSVCLSLYLSVFLFVTFLSVSLSVCLSVCHFSVCLLLVCLSICLLFCLSFCLSFVCLSVCSSVCLSVCLSVCPLSVCRSIFVSVSPSMYLNS